jgi:hypothetical protein
VNAPIIYFCIRKKKFSHFQRSHWSVKLTFEIMENGYLAPLNKYIPFSDHENKKNKKKM